MSDSWRRRIGNKIAQGSSRRDRRSRASRSARRRRESGTPRGGLSACSQCRWMRIPDRGHSPEFPARGEGGRWRQNRRGSGMSEPTGQHAGRKRPVAGGVRGDCRAIEVRPLTRIVPSTSTTRPQGLKSHAGVQRHLRVATVRTDLFATRSGQVACCVIRDHLTPAWAGCQGVVPASRGLCQAAPARRRRPCGVPPPESARSRWAW